MLKSGGFSFTSITFAWLSFKSEKDKPMKKKFSIINPLMGLVVLFAILFQSFDAMSHLENQFSKKQCHHKYNHHKTEVSHAHEGFDHCFTCEFTFSNFITASKISFAFPKIEIATRYTSHYSKEITQAFRGSLFALRAPPSFIV